MSSFFEAGAGLTAKSDASWNDVKTDLETALSALAEWHKDGGGAETQEGVDAMKHTIRAMSAAVTSYKQRQPGRKPALTGWKKKIESRCSTGFDNCANNRCTFR